MIDEAEFRREIRRAYEAGVMEARAALFADLRALIDDTVSQIYGLRCELRRALNLPPAAGPDDRGTLQ